VVPGFTVCPLLSWLTAELEYLADHAVCESKMKVKINEILLRKVESFFI
jgi:hypothetical protein